MSGVTDQGSGERGIEEIRATGAAWVTESELERLCDLAASNARQKEALTEALEAAELAWSWLRWFDGHDEKPEPPVYEVRMRLDGIVAALSAAGTEGHNG